MLVLEGLVGLHKTIQLQLLQHDWFALETNQDHSVIFKIAPKYYILDSFVDYEGYSISSKGLLTTVVDINGHMPKCGPLEKGMANHFSILSLRTP